MFKKAFVISSLIAVGLSAHATEAQFCKGFAEGYIKGWNFLAGTEAPPVPPCHIGLLENDDDSTLSSFEQGEQKGMQRGIKAFKDDVDSGSSTDLARKKAAKAAEVAAQMAALQDEKRRAVEVAAQKDAAIAASKAEEQAYAQHAVALVACLKNAIPNVPQPPPDPTGGMEQEYIRRYADQLESTCREMRVVGLLQMAFCINDAPSDVRAALQIQASRLGGGGVLTCDAHAVPAVPQNPAGAHGLVFGMQGASKANLPPAIAAALGDRQLKGMFVGVVVPGSVADKAGLKVGDDLYDFGGKTVMSTTEMREYLASVAPGTAIPVKVIRGSADLTLTAQF